MKNPLFYKGKINSYFLMGIIGILLLQSCKTYQKIDYKTTALTEGKIYKVVIEDELEKVQLIAIKDSVASFKYGETEIQMPLKDIKQIRERKHSTAATVFLVLGSFVGGVIIAFIFLLASLSGFN